MRYLALLLSLLVSCGGTAYASLLITLDQPSQTGSPGDTLIFSGVLSNPDPERTFLNSVNLNLAGSSFTVNYIDQFLNNVPISLGPGESRLSIKLFDVLLNLPFSDPFGPYIGTYTLVGGIDGDSQDVLFSADFTVTAQEKGGSPVPEPSTFLLAMTLISFFYFRFQMGGGKRKSLDI